jgi:hypothetical protein
VAEVVSPDGEPGPVDLVQATIVPSEPGREGTARFTSRSCHPAGALAVSGQRQLSPAHFGSNRVRGLKGAFTRRSTVEIELHRIGNLDPVAVAGQ